jgi:hypothetical protein
MEQAMTLQEYTAQPEEDTPEDDPEIDIADWIDQALNPHPPVPSSQ